MRKICPKCGGREFITTAHVMQSWKVDSEGRWIETIEDCIQIDSNPDPDNIWICVKCGAEAVDDKIA